MNALPVTRCADVRIVPDARRVIVKPFLSGDDVVVEGRSRTEVVVERIMAMDESAVHATLDAVLVDFGERHRDLRTVLASHFDTVATRVAVADGASSERRLLIGAYFSHEYSIEAAALGNPSMVLAPDQEDLGDASARFVMSLRAVGEGHLSSIEFRTGLIGRDLTVSLDPPTRYATTGRRAGVVYDKAFFEAKLGELGVLNQLARTVLGSLPDDFTNQELDAALHPSTEHAAERILSAETTHVFEWLASSNYRVDFAPDSEISERVIFPSGPTESQGMEDVRLVRFIRDDGTVVYYGTYTAFDGHQILPQLLETTDFVSYRVATLSGACARNKGIALFPRMVDGQFMALGRHDNMNNYVMRSPDVRVWSDAERIQEPQLPWELIQLGNCGSPLETEAGWLVVTHGVGPFRRYSLGAILLDIDDPARLVGQLDEPLLAPEASEREGYVPNVVYSCGSMLVDGHLVLPYGFADVGAGIATVNLDELLTRLTSR